METKPYNLQSPEEIAKEYGGNKQKIAQATQSGLLDPTAAVMAGMFIDRMRNAQMEEQAPAQTVAQDILAPQQMQQMQQPMPQQMGGQTPPQGMPQSAGLEALPVPDQMFSGPGMAGGGLVAFANAGSVFNELEPYVPPKKEPMPGIIGSAISSVINKIPSGGSQLRIDPVTGEPVTLGEFLRLQEARDVAQARAQSPIPVGTSSAAKDMDGGVSEGVDMGIQRGPEVVVKKELPPEVAAPAAPAAPTAPKAQQGSALDEYARMLMGSLQDKETSKEDAKNMALLQAGLGIMGGESQYALQNIARGALPATQAYQQQMAAGRKEERETIGALADLELKAKELGLTEKRYTDLARIAEMQVAASLGKASTTGQFTQKDFTKAVLDATKAIMSADPTMEPTRAAQLAKDQVNAVLGKGPESGDGARTMDFNQLGK